MADPALEGRAQGGQAVLKTVPGLNLRVRFLYPLRHSAVLARPRLTCEVGPAKGDGRTWWSRGAVTTSLRHGVFDPHPSHGTMATRKVWTR